MPQNGKYASSVQKPELQQAGATSLLNILHQERKLIQTIALFLGAFTIVYSLVIYTPKYASQATVLIKESAHTNYLSNESYQTTSSEMANPVLNTMGLLKTDGISKALWKYYQASQPDELKKLKIKNYDDWDEFFGDGSDFISTRAVPGTDYILVKFTWSDGKIAQAGLKNTLEAFKAASRDLNQLEQHERSEYITKKISEVKNRLEIIRDQIRIYKQDNNTLDIAHETESYAKSRVVLQETLASVDADAVSKQGELNEYESMLGMDTHQAIDASSVGGNPTLSKLYEKLYTNQEQHKSLKGRYTDKHPKMVSLLLEIHQTEEDIRKEINRMNGNMGKNTGKAVLDKPRGDAISSLMVAKAEEASLRMKADNLRSSLNSLNTKLKSLPQVEKTLTTLQDEETSLRESLKTLEQKALEANLREMQTLSNVFVVDLPSLPRKANFPSNIHILVLGLLLSIASSISVALLKHKLLSAKREPSLNLSVTSFFEHELNHQERYTSAVHQD